MRKISVGIAYEDGTDYDVITILVNRVLKDYKMFFDPNNGDKRTKMAAKTSILGFLKAYVKIFIDANVDLAVFSTDQDNDKRSRRKEIEESIKLIDEMFLTKTIIAVPYPHIESWLLIQDDVIKRLLGIDGSSSLKYANMNPKERLISLYRESDIYKGTLSQLKTDIANLMDIGICCQGNTEFKNFIQDIVTAAKFLSSKK